MLRRFADDCVQICQGAPKRWAQPRPGTTQPGATGVQCSYPRCQRGVRRRLPQSWYARGPGRPVWRSPVVEDHAVECHLIGLARTLSHRAENPAAPSPLLGQLRIALRAISGVGPIATVAPRPILPNLASWTTEDLLAHPVGFYPAPFARKPSHHAYDTPAGRSTVRAAGGKAAGQTSGKLTDDRMAGGVHVGAHVSLHMGQPVGRGSGTAVDGSVQRGKHGNALEHKPWLEAGVRPDNDSMRREVNPRQEVAELIGRRGLLMCEVGLRGQQPFSDLQAQLIVDEDEKLMIPCHYAKLRMRPETPLVSQP